MYIVVSENNINKCDISKVLVNILTMFTIFKSVRFLFEWDVVYTVAPINWSCFKRGILVFNNFHTTYKYFKSTIVWSTGLESEQKAWIF